MDFKHILSSLRRSPTGAILVALQIALALAIVVNSLFIVIQRLETPGAGGFPRSGSLTVLPKKAPAGSFAVPAFSSRAVPAAST